MKLNITEVIISEYLWGFCSTLIINLLVAMKFFGVTTRGGPFFLTAGVPRIQRVVYRCLAV
jgi:hypothetical protein